MFLGTWPSYIVGDAGTILSYSPVTGSVKQFETPFDDWSPNERPDLYSAFGTSHDNFYVLGDGYFYHYHSYPSSHPDYDPSDTSPKWESLRLPVDLPVVRGTYGAYISDVWVYNHNTVFILVHQPGTGSLVYEWDGVNWGDGTLLPTSSLIRGIWGLGPNDVFAVGVGATVLHYDGATWSNYNDLHLDQFNSYTDIWGTSHNSLYLVGDQSPTSSQLVSFDGEGWSSINIPTDEGLYSIVGWSEAMHSIYLTSQEGEILNYVDAVAGQDEDLAWIENGGFIYDFASDTETLYALGTIRISETEWAQPLFSYSSGRTFSHLNIQPEYTDFYSSNTLAVSEDKLYVGGWVDVDLAYICSMNKDGSDDAYGYIDFTDKSFWLREMAVDQEGYLYLGGSIEGEYGGQISSGYIEKDTLEDDDLYSFDAFLGKYSPDGELVWSHIFGAYDEWKHKSFFNGERVEKIIVDSNGDILVAGYSMDSSGFMVGGTDGLLVSPEYPSGVEEGNFIFVVKFSSDGTPLVAKAYTPGHKGDIDLVESNEGYYLTSSTGYILNNDRLVRSGSHNIQVKKLDVMLEPVWERVITYDNRQYVRSATSCDDGNLYITGYSTGSVGGHKYSDKGDIFVLKLESDGLIHGVKMLGGTDRDEGTFVYLDKYSRLNVLVDTQSPDVYGYVEGLRNVLWRDISIPYDQYAECRVSSR